jgi:hypothetical protein
MPKYDRSDPDWRVLKLTRAGHHLWAEKRKAGRYLCQEQAIGEGLETLWRLKRELKAEIAIEKAIESRKIKARMRG